VGAIGRGALLNASLLSLSSPTQHLFPSVRSSGEIYRRVYYNVCPNQRGVGTQLHKHLPAGSSLTLDLSVDRQSINDAKAIAIYQFN